MSKITLEPNNSGTGTFTIAAPNSNTNRTLTLPDEAGTALTDTTDLEPQVKTSLNATGDAPLFACRAFCNFDGTGTVSIRESGNVSSITDFTTGRYFVNFATDMPDANYSAVASKDEFGDMRVAQAGDISLSGVRIESKDGDAVSNIDSPYVFFAAFR